MQHAHVRVFGGDCATIDGVAFAGIVDTAGETPLFQKAAAIESPVEGFLVEVDLAAGGDVIAGGAEGLIVGGLIEGVIVRIAGDIGVFVFTAAGEASSGRGAKGGGAENVVETNAASGEGGDMGEFDGDFGVAWHPIGAPLIGEEEEEVGFALLGGEGSRGGGGGKESSARRH